MSDIPDRGEPLRIWWNKNLHGKITPMKLAAHAAHAALAAYGIKYGHPIVVLSAGKAKIEAMPISIHDAGYTELAPGTLTTGVEKTWRAPVTEAEVAAATDSLAEWGLPDVPRRLLERMAHSALEAARGV